MFVGFILARPRCRRVHYGSFCSLWGTIGDVRFSRWVHYGSHWWSTGSFGWVACPGCRRVYSGSLLRILTVVGFIWVRRVHSGASWVSLYSIGFFGSILMLPENGWVQSGSLGSFTRALVFLGFIGVDLLHSRAWSGSFVLIGLMQARPAGLSVHSGVPRVS